MCSSACSSNNSRIRPETESTITFKVFQTTFSHQRNRFHGNCRFGFWCNRWMVSCAHAVESTSHKECASWPEQHQYPTFAFLYPRSGRLRVINPNSWATPLPLTWLLLLFILFLTNFTRSVIIKKQIKKQINFNYELLYTGLFCRNIQ